jgi:hypothetical protein
MGLKDTVILILIFVSVAGLLWYLNRKGAISNEGEMYNVEHLTCPSLTEGVVNEQPAHLLSQFSNNLTEQFTEKLVDSNNVVSSLDNATKSLAKFNENEMTSVSNEEIDKIINERSQQQLEFNNSDLLPQEINKDWFESNFSNARIKIGNDNLINTDRYMVGINTIGQSLKNPSYDLRPSPPCPKVTVSPWNNSTIEPDFNIKPWN